MIRENLWLPSRFLAYLCILGALFAIMGAIGYKLVRDQAASYSDIIERQIPILRLTRQITQQSANGKRVIDAISTQPSAAELESAQQKWDVTITGLDDHLLKLKGLAVEFGGREEFAQLVKERREYLAMVQRSLAPFDTGATGKTFPHAAINLEYDDYRRARDTFSARCEETAIERSSRLTMATHRSLRFFILFAIWPVLLALGVFVHGFVSTAAVFYRAK